MRAYIYVAGNILTLNAIGRKHFKHSYFQAEIKAFVLVVTIFNPLESLNFSVELSTLKVLFIAQNPA